MGHQGMDRTIDLLRERVYWPSMVKDTQNWVTGCHHCQVAWGDYNQPKPKIGHLEANNPLDLVCLDFTKIDPSKSGKENVLIITDAFSKFSLAVCTPNQTAKTVAKVLVEKWFHIYGIPSWIHSDQGRCFDTNMIKALCKMYGVDQTFTSPYNPRSNAFCERFKSYAVWLYSKHLKLKKRLIGHPTFWHWSSLITLLHMHLLVINHTNLCLDVEHLLCAITG